MEGSAGSSSLYSAVRDFGGLLTTITTVMTDICEELGSALELVFCVMWPRKMVARWVERASWVFAVIKYAYILMVHYQWIDGYLTTIFSSPCSDSKTKTYQPRQS